MFMGKSKIWIGILFPQALGNKLGTGCRTQKRVLKSGNSHFGSRWRCFRAFTCLLCCLFCIHVRRPWDADNGSLPMHQRDGCRSFVVPVNLPCKEMTIRLQALGNQCRVKYMSVQAHETHARDRELTDQEEIEPLQHANLRQSMS